MLSANLREPNVRGDQGYERAWSCTSTILELKYLRIDGPALITLTETANGW